MASLANASAGSLQRQLDLRLARQHFIQGFVEGKLVVPLDSDAVNSWMRDGGFTNVGNVRNMPIGDLFADSFARLQQEIKELKAALAKIGSNSSAGTSPSRESSAKRQRTRTRSSSGNSFDAGASPVLNPAKAFLKSPTLVGMENPSGDGDDAFQSNFFL